MEPITIVTTALKAGQFILAAVQFVQNEKIVELQKEIEDLKDKDLKSAMSFVQIASMCSSELEAMNNLNLAYACYVQATNVYSQRELSTKISAMWSAEIRNSINKALGDNWLSRKLTGASEAQQAYEVLIAEEAKLLHAYHGVATFSYAKKEYAVAVGYYDKAIGLHIDNITLLNNFEKLLSLHSGLRDSQVVHHVFNYFYERLYPIQDMNQVKSMIREYNLSDNFLYPNYSKLLRFSSTEKFFHES